MPAAVDLAVTLRKIKRLFSENLSQEWACLAKNSCYARSEFFGVVRSAE